MLAVTRALMLKPSVLLLDEVMTGLAPRIVDDLADTFRQLRDQGVAIVVAESSSFVAELLVERAYILVRGRVTALESGSGILSAYQQAMGVRHESGAAISRQDPCTRSIGNEKGSDFMVSPGDTVRLTQFAAGGGCACKIPPGELESLLGGIAPLGGPDLLVGLDNGDDAAVVRIDEHRAVIATADFFTPLIDDPYDWGRIAAVNALSDVYAMGGEPLVAVNLLSWPRDVLDLSLAAEVLRGGADVCRQAGVHLAGGHSIDDKEPKYGLAVTGLADPARLLTLDAARPGTPLTLTKPLGVGILNNRHKVTGEVFSSAVESMVTLNRDASRAALAAGAVAATDVTGFGLLGHAMKMARASGVSLVIESQAVPYLPEVRQSLADGFVPGGSRRNLDWVRPHLASAVSEDELLLLADAQTSGGLLVAGEIAGYPVIGHVAERSDSLLNVA